MSVMPGRPVDELYQRGYWRRTRWKNRSSDLCRTALHSDVFELAHPDLVLEEIRRGPRGRLRRADAGVAKRRAS